MSTSGRTETPGRVHRQHEHRDADLRLGRFGVGAREQQAEVGVRGVRRPDLLPVDDPLVTIADGPASASETRSEPASGSEKSWHHCSSARDQRRQVATLLCVRARAPSASQRRGACRCRAAATTARRTVATPPRRPWRGPGVSPRPPYSTGRWTPDSPAAANSRCSSRALLDESVMPVGRPRDRVLATRRRTPGRAARTAPRERAAPRPGTLDADHTRQNRSIFVDCPNSRRNSGLAIPSRRAG